MSLFEQILLFAALTEFAACCYLCAELDYNRRKNSLLEDANERLYDLWFGHWKTCHEFFKDKTKP